jgi:hypothetical protein
MHSDELSAFAVAQKTGGLQLRVPRPKGSWYFSTTFVPHSRAELTRLDTSNTHLVCMFLILEIDLPRGHYDDLRQEKEPSHRTLRQDYLQQDRR